MNTSDRIVFHVSWSERHFFVIEPMLHVEVRKAHGDFSCHRSTTICKYDSFTFQTGVGHHNSNLNKIRNIYLRYYTTISHNVAILTIYFSNKNENFN